MRARARELGRCLVLVTLGVGQVGADGRAALVDGHIHYSADAWQTVPPEEAIAILRRAGIERAFVSSTPDDGTLALHALAPDLVVPVLRPYRSRADMGGWFADPEVLAHVESRLARGVYQGIGEFHLAEREAHGPVVEGLVALAVEHDLFLHLHGDAGAVRRLLAIDAGARILWAHAGMTEPPDVVAAVLREHRTVTVELSFRYREMLAGDGLDSRWEALLVEFPDRFVLGTDTWAARRWLEVGSTAETARSLLSRLPPGLARRLARDNAAGLLRPRGP